MISYKKWNGGKRDIRRDANERKGMSYDRDRRRKKNGRRDKWSDGRELEHPTDWEGRLLKQTRNRSSSRVGMEGVWMRLAYQHISSILYCIIWSLKWVTRLRIQYRTLVSRGLCELCYSWHVHSPRKFTSSRANKICGAVHSASSHWSEWMHWQNRIEQLCWHPYRNPHLYGDEIYAADEMNVICCLILLCGSLFPSQALAEIYVQLGNGMEMHTLQRTQTDRWAHASAHTHTHLYPMSWHMHIMSFGAITYSEWGDYTQ